MPTFTTVALDRLIEPKASMPVAAGENKPGAKIERRNSTPVLPRQGSGINGSDKKPALRNSSSTATINRKHHWTQISPALYATPEPTPLPDSPTSFPPSPYIVNHKRRGPRLSKSFSEDEVAFHQAVDEAKAAEVPKSLEAEDVESYKVNDPKATVPSAVEENHVKFVFDGELGHKDFHDDKAGQDNSKKSVMLDGGSEIDDFFDPQDSLSVKSSIDGETNHVFERSLTLNTPGAVFYDAWEELSCESGSQLHPNELEAELRAMRLSLLMEIERRKQAEDCLNDIRSQWGRIREQLALVGLTLPADPTMVEDESADDPGEELCRQVTLIRFVSNTIGKGIAKAELEVEMEAQLESKNFEIARLLDRLRYYEAVNHEMSQRNQETVETMRRLRQRRKRRQRWIWGSIAAAITVGTAALALSYLPTGKGSSSTDASRSHTSEGNHSAK